MKVMITGAAGFVGTHLAKLFLKNQECSSLILYDKMTYAADVENILSILPDRTVKLVVGDLCDDRSLLAALDGVDTVINAAAESHVDNSFGNSLVFTKTNTLGTHTLLDCCREAKVAHLVHISTDEVFGENDTESPHTETSVFNPTNPYAASKAAAEMLIKAYRKSYKFPATIIRANNMYGKYQYPEKLIPKTIVRLQHGLKATIHGKGMNKRSYLSAEDFARAVKKIVTQGLDFESINVYSLEEYTNIEVINMICKEMELSFTEHTEYVDDRPFNDSRYYIRSENIGRFSWEPEATLSAEMPNLVEWYTNKYSTHKPRML